LKNENDLKALLAKQEKESKEKNEKLINDLQLKNEEIENLNKAILKLQDSTNMGKKDREIKQLIETQNTLETHFEELHSEYEKIKNENMELLKKNKKFDVDIEQEVQDRIEKENKKLKKLKNDYDDLLSRYNEEDEKYKNLEIEKNEFSNRVDELTHWKTGLIIIIINNNNF
jgi:chromosome segregation ATPase